MTHGVCGCAHCREIDAARVAVAREDEITRLAALDDWVAEHDSHYWPTLPPDYETELLATCSPAPVADLHILAGVSQGSCHHPACHAMPRHPAHR
jgi:hypothetical protein